MINAPKFCFSYIRFSAENQRGNNSVDRQSEVAPKIAAQKGWTLREDWNVRQDAVSAYKKHNFPKLMAIIDAARDGKIPQGTVIIVEAIDRLTRATLDEGREMIRQILLSGIEICDNEGNHYTKEDLNDIVKLLTLCLRIVAANEYCSRLAGRVKAAYQNRCQSILNGQRLKADGQRIRVTNLPTWIDGETWTLNEKAETLGSIFDMYLKGSGPASIAKYFNQQKIPSLTGKGFWSQAVIYKLLTDRKLVGEYRVNGEIVKDFYPAVITEETYFRVRSRLDDNKGKRPTGNHRGNITNIFSGVAVCRCGERIKVANGRKGTFVTCYGKIKGTNGCTDPMIKFDEFEKSFVNCLLSLRPEQLTTDETGATANAELQILRGQLAETEKQIVNITEALSVTVTKALVLRQAQLETEVESLKGKIELAHAKSVSASGSVEKLNQIKQRLENLKTDSDLRATVQAWIRENVNKIVLNKSEKTFSVDLRNGNFVRMNLDGGILECKSFVQLFTGSTPEQLAVNG